MKSLLAIGTALSLIVTPLCASAQEAGSAPAAQPAAAPRMQTAPKLILAISIDQFSADLFAEYRQYFTGGLRRLSEGVVFPSGYQSHAATETCPGHSTILTGMRPAHTGIIANGWGDFSAARADKSIYCAEDETQPGTDSDHYVASPVHLLVPTLGERMKKADPRTRSVSVAGKDRAALMMGGHVIDQAWWWGKNGFVSTVTKQADPVVAQVNAAIARTIATARPPMALPPVCATRSRAIDLGTRTVGDGRFGRDAGDVSAFHDSPEFDAATLALAAALRQSMKLGEGPQTDIMDIGLSATDYIGHGYGTEGSEMCLQLMALDQSLGDFFDQMDATGVDYAVVLTADHGGHDIPERNREHAVPGDKRISPDLKVKALSAAVARKLGLSGEVLAGDIHGDLYVTPAVSAAQKPMVVKAALAELRANPEVAMALSADEIAATLMPSGPPETWTLAERARASFYAPRSGDIYVMLKPRITPIDQTEHGSIATHGSPWDYDRRVPILFWRKGIGPFEQPNSVETVDIVPTLAALVYLPITDKLDGRCLDLDAGAASTCS